MGWGLLIEDGEHTMEAMSVVVRRIGALLAVCSAVLHGAVLGPGVAAWVAALTVLMLVGCLYCAYELWIRDTARAWVLVAVMNLVMVGVHLPMSGAHHHVAVHAVEATAPYTPMQLATAVAIIEALLAATVLFVRTRAFAPVVASRTSGDQDSGRSGDGRR